MNEVSFIVAGSIAPQWHRQFTRWGEGVDDFRPAFKEIVENFREVERAQFATEGRAGGRAWEPLSDNPPGKGYASWKHKHYPGAKILEMTGTLRDAAINPDVYMNQTRLTMTVNDSGMGRAKARYHQEGTRFMPARPIVQLSSEHKQEWGRIIHRHVFSAADKLRAPWGGLIG